MQLEARLDKVERNIDLLHWNATIEYQLYKGTEYSLLPDEEKIVCLANDFFHKTKGTWSTADLILLKSTLAELGLPIKQAISSKAFYNYLIEEPLLINRLFDGISLEGLQSLEAYHAPLVKGDYVQQGAKVAIVREMTLQEGPSFFNAFGISEDIKSHTNGIVISFLVKNGEKVIKGQPIMLIMLLLSDE